MAREDVFHRLARAQTGLKPSMTTAARRICRPIAYAAIVTGAVWTVSTTTAIVGGPDHAHGVEKLRIASSMLVGGLLLAALAHWKRPNGEERLNDSGDPQ